MATKSFSSKQIVKAFIAGTEIPVKKGTATFTKQKSDATGSTSAGWLEFTVGNRGMTFSIEGDLKKDVPQRVLTDTKAIDIPADSDDENVAFKFEFADGTGCEGVAILEPTITGDPQGGANVGFTISGTANGPVTTY